MPFTYQPYESARWTGSIADILRAQGQIPAEAALRIGQVQADAARQRGAAWGGAAQQIGQSATAAVQQATDPRRKLEEQQLELGAQQLEGVKTAKLVSAKANQIMQGLLQTSEDGTVTIDRGKLRQGFASANLPIQQQELYFKSLDEVDASTQKFTSARTDHLADLAHAVIQAGGTPDALAFGIALAKANGSVTDAQLAPVMDAIGQGADIKTVLSSVRGQSEKYKDLSKPVIVPKDAILADPSRPGAPPIISNVGADEGGYTINGQRFRKDGTPIGAPVPKQAEPPKAGTVEAWVARDRQLAIAKNGGNALTPDQEKAVDAASLKEFKETNADPELRAAALAQKNIAASLAQLQLNQAPTKDQAASVADDLVNHRIAPEQLASLFSTRGREGLAFKLAVAAEAKKIDPAFNFEEASATYTLVKSPAFQNTIRVMDSTLESMPRLLQNARTLGNGDWRSWNQLKNAAAGQFNSTELKRFKTDAVLVGDEVAKILSGGGTGSATSDAKLKQGMDLIGQSDSVPAIAAALEEIQNLIGFRRKAMTRGTYMEGTSAVKEPAAAAAPLQVGGFTVVVH